MISARYKKAISRKMLPGVIVVMSAAALIVALNMREDEQKYIRKIEKRRSDTNKFMRNSPESPFRGDLLRQFNGLNYFAVNTAFRVSARLERIPGEELIEVPVSLGSSISYIKFAWIHFNLQGRRHRLLVLKPIGILITNKFTIMFTDLTSGVSTYGGGRYVDLYDQEENWIELDFNKAYNPYCVYDESYICPLAPPENQLSVEILAGEKDYMTAPLL